MSFTPIYIYIKDKPKIIKKKIKVYHATKEDVKKANEIKNKSSPIE